MEILRAFVHDRLYLPSVVQLEDAFTEIKRAFTHGNPDYFKKKKLGFWIGATPKELRNWKYELFEGLPCLVVARGGKQLVEEVLAKYRVKVEWIDRRISLPPVIHLKNNIKLRPDQEALYRKVIETETCLIRSPTGSGKCLGGATRVIMADGETMRAQDIERGFHLMGPDSSPREVLSVTKGRDVLYRVLPQRGTPWVANKEHVLVLYHAEDGEIEISIQDYLEKSESWQKKAFLFTPKTPFYWSEMTQASASILPIPPYFFGCWWISGYRGSKDAACMMPYRTKTLANRLIDMATPLGLRLIRTEYKIHGRARPHLSIKGNDNVEEILTLLGGELEMPRAYKLSHPIVRYELLAGIVDGAGRVEGDSFVIRKKSLTVRGELLFLARSLGLKAFDVATSNKFLSEVRITGEIWRVPTREIYLDKNKQFSRYLFPFRVEEVGVGDYYGWTLSGDGRFLLEDFTVTHNTEIALKATETMLKTSGPVLAMVWETELAHQWIKRASTRFQIPESEIGFIGGGIERYKPITIGMQQSLWKKGRTYAPKFGGVIVDEVQRFAARTYQEVIDVFPSRYRIGISADETRKDGLEFLIYESFGEIAGEVRKEKLIDEGKIHDVVQRLVPTGWNYEIVLGNERYQWTDLPAEQKDWNDLIARMCASEARNDLIWRFMLPSIRAKKTLMVITSRTAHASYWVERIRQSGVSAGLMLGGPANAEEFKRTRDGLMSRDVQVAVGTNQKTGQGHDIPQWDRGFVLTPLAGNKQQYEQLVGRLRRTCPGKTDAVNYYFWDELVYPFHKSIISARYPETYVWTGKEFSKV